MPVDPNRYILDSVARTVATVPAYRAFLDAHGIDPEKITDAAAFQQLPLTTKANYHHRYPLPDRCRGGDLTNCDLIAVSSGSTGTPTFWPRTAADEAASTRRFAQVLVDGFGAATTRTLAVVCFPLGTWVGGLYTLSCLRALAVELPLTIVAPGNNKAEILRVIPELGSHVDQVVLLGYPPFLKDVIDTGANVFPETVTIGLEQPGVSEWVTGKFVLEVWENADHDRTLRVTVELVPDEPNTPERTRRVAESVRDELLRRNSEYAHYVPPERHLPHVELRPTGDPDYFPIGVKHRYTR
ncbi:hypothetical protein OG563_44325 [Nocardia vinacea]|uniref:Phenylacetate--CoA ligase n=1 Tax=Nocardia vinacea TaxID=96468 RepID=A0ABZ1YVX0_9NOCA|nr:hypothetical protein [Nocardia vinacea]